jgi:hypothetical protein
MIRSLVARGALLGVFVLANACGSLPPTAPSTTNPSLSGSAPASPGVTFPPPSGPSRTFVFDHALGYPVRNYTEQSRIVLYDNGAFALQYLSPIGAYRGTYAQSGGTLSFGWEGASAAGVWMAGGVITNDSLTVRYNEIMQLSDFEDAVYRLTSTPLGPDAADGRSWSPSRGRSYP